MLSTTLVAYANDGVDDHERVALDFSWILKEHCSDNSALSTLLASEIEAGWHCLMISFLLQVHTLSLDDDVVRRDRYIPSYLTSSADSDRLPAMLGDDRQPIWTYPMALAYSGDGRLILAGEAGTAPPKRDSTARLSKRFLMVTPPH